MVFKWFSLPFLAVKFETFCYDRTLYITFSFTQMELHELQCFKVFKLTLMMESPRKSCNHSIQTFLQPQPQLDRLWSFWHTHIQHADFCFCALVHLAPETFHVLSSLCWQSILTYVYGNWTKVEAIGISSTEFINSIPCATSKVKIRGEKRGKFTEGHYIYPDQPITFFHLSFCLCILFPVNILIISINWCLKVYFHEFCICNNFKYVSFCSSIGLLLVLILVILTVDSWKPPTKVFTIHILKHTSDEKTCSRN